MLTAAQCRTVAYLVDEEIVCTNCVDNTEDCTSNELIEYSAKEYANGHGLYCDRCSAEIVEPYEDEDNKDTKDNDDDDTN